jgi:hypothetical protein
MAERFQLLRHVRKVYILGNKGGPQDNEGCLIRNVKKKSLIFEVERM